MCASRPQLGDHFMDNYGYCDVLGKKDSALVQWEYNITLGFHLMGPGLNYPPHQHEPAEIYWPFSGDGKWGVDWEPAVPRSPGEMILHKSWQAHEMVTQSEPQVVPSSYTTIRFSAHCGSCVCICGSEMSVVRLS